MDYKITGDNNLIRVFEVPEHFPKDTCFHGGVNVTFTMVDWFGVDLGSQFVRKDYLEHMVLKALQKKPYYDPRKSYLFISRFGWTKLVEAHVALIN